MARIPLSTTMSKRILLALIAACMTVSAGADQILLDNGATQLNVGTTANDGTGDTMRAGALKMKQWAADSNAMNTELYAATSGTVYSIANCPGVALDGTTDDAPAINACIAAQPEGTTFIFPSGKTIGLKAPLTGFKTGQRFIGNGATLRAITVSSALGANLVNGANTVTVADRTGFTCGQVIKVGARNGSTSFTGTNSMTSISGTSGSGNCAPATGPGTLYMSSSFSTCYSTATDGSCSSNPTLTTGNVISSGVLFFNTSDAVTDLELTGFTLDGARPVGGDVDVRIPRWEPDKLVETSRGGRAYVHDLLLKNADGDGVSIAGDFSRAMNIHGVDIGGNLVHFSQGYYQQASRISGTNINLAGPLMGHQDGLISYSNKCNYSILSDLIAYNAKRVIGGLDAYGGTRFSATNMVGINLTEGPFRIAWAGTSLSATTANASPILTPADSVQGWLTGMNVSGTGIPAGTYITAVGDTTVTMSANATASGTVSVTLTGGPTDISISNGTFDNSSIATTGIIELEGNTEDGTWARGISISGIVGKNMMLWAKRVEGSNISMIVDNGGRSTLPTGRSPANTTSVLIDSSRNTKYDLQVDGGSTGIYVTGALTNGVVLSGIVQNPQGADSEAVYLDPTLPATPEVHLREMHLVLDLALATSWAASTVYSAGAIVSNNGNNYIARVAGTSAGSGGPTVKSQTITDNTVTWGYLNTPGRWSAFAGSTGSKAIQAFAGFTLTDSVLDVTTGTGVIRSQGDSLWPTVEIRRNLFKHISTDSCCLPVWFSGSHNRLVFTDNDFPGYDMNRDHAVYTSASITFNDVVFARNTIDSNRYGGSAASVVRFRGTVNRGVFKDNILPYRSGAGAGWTTPTTWAEQEVTAADPIRLDSAADTLVIGNVMRKATAQ